MYSLKSFPFVLFTILLVVNCSYNELFFTASASSSNSRSPRSFGWVRLGREVFYQLSLRNPRHICGAVAIDKYVALTAAHCTHRIVDNRVESFSLQDLWIAGGRLELDSMELKKIRKIVVHPNYNATTKINDIALLILKQPFEWTLDYPNILQKIGLAGPGSPDFSNSEAFISGYGTTEKGHGSKSLIYSEISILSNPECKERYNESVDFQQRIINTTICAAKQLKGACKGDDGGPLVVDIPSSSSGKGHHLLVGIISEGFGCTSQTPDLSVRISSVYDWIYTEMSKWTGRPLKCPPLNNNNSTNTSDGSHSFRGTPSEFKRECDEASRILCVDPRSSFCLNNHARMDQESSTVQAATIPVLKKSNAGNKIIQGIFKTLHVLSGFQIFHALRSALLKL